LTVPASVLVKILISGWAPKTEDDKNDSLQNAGKYIGILERLFVFAFILTDHWEGIGFMLAAKSIFRFGDLKESKDRKLTEYVMIGTLLSFGMAILVGLLLTSLAVRFALLSDHAFQGSQIDPFLIPRTIPFFNGLLLDAG